MKTKGLFHYLTITVTAGILTGCIVIAPGSCNRERVKGSGNVVTEERQVAGFNRVSLKGMGKVKLTRGDRDSIHIITDDNILPLIKTSVSNNRLEISNNNYNLRPTQLEYDITVRELKGISIAGSGDVIGMSRFISDTIKAEIAGSGDISLEVETERLKSGITGSGAIHLSGATNSHDTSITGSGEINAFDLEAQNVSVAISGSGDCRINAAESLTANISGSGDVVYRGRPQIDSRISGSGKLKYRE